MRAYKMTKYTEKKNKAVKFIINNILLKSGLFHYDVNSKVLDDVVYRDYFGNVRGLQENQKEDFFSDLQRSDIINKNGNKTKSFIKHTNNKQQHDEILSKIKDKISEYPELEDLTSYINQGWAALTMQLLNKYKKEDESFIKLDSELNDTSFTFAENSITFDIVYYKRLMNPNINVTNSDKTYKTETSIKVELNQDPNISVNYYNFTLNSKITEQSYKLSFSPLTWIKKTFDSLVSFIMSFFYASNEPTSLTYEDVYYILHPEEVKERKDIYLENSSQNFTPTYQNIRDFVSSNSNEIIAETKQVLNQISIPGMHL